MFRWPAVIFLWIKFVFCLPTHCSYYSLIEFCGFHNQLQGLFSAGVIYALCIRNKFKQQGSIVLHHAFTFMQKNYVKRNMLAPTGITHSDAFMSNLYVKWVFFRQWNKCVYLSYYLNICMFFTLCDGKFESFEVVAVAVLKVQVLLYVTLWHWVCSSEHFRGSFSFTNSHHIVYLDDQLKFTQNIISESQWS